MIRRLVVTLLMIGGGLPALPGVSPMAATPPRIVFSEHRLGNGLRVIISEDHAAPVVSVAVYYDVGSRNERPGRTGLAHLFEHMMFKGSPNVGSGEHAQLVFGNGGEANGSTNKELTRYFERLPANQLDLALFLEADRMRALDIDRANLDNQIGTVSEERKQGHDNQPYGRTFEVIDELAFTNFAYRHPTIGSLEDLRAASVADVVAFFTTYYAPNNAALAIVGDVKTSECLAKVRKYFGTIPRRPPPPPPETLEPPQTAERRQTIDDPLARLPRVDMVYHTPATLTRDDDALAVTGLILSMGRSSRFYESIVRQKQLASTVTASVGESRGPGLFHVGAMAMPGKSIGDLEQAIDAEIERLKTGTIEAWEVEKARNTARRGLLGGLGGSVSRALMLAQLAVGWGDPGLINTRYERLSAVGAADVQRVARKYLVATNRVVVVTNPKPAAPQPGVQKGSL